MRGLNSTLSACYVMCKTLYIGISIVLDHSGAGGNNSEREPLVRMASLVNIVTAAQGQFFRAPYFLFYFIFLAAPHGMWDLSSLSRGQTHISCIGSSYF